MKLVVPSDGAQRCAIPIRPWVQAITWRGPERDRSLGAPDAGPLLMDVVMPDLPGFYHREWVENLDRGIMARLAADDWLRFRMIVPAAKNRSDAM